MFGEIRLVTPYFQRMTLRSEIPKIIDTQLQNNSLSTSFFERSVNYFENFGTKCHLLKIGCKESSFTKHNKKIKNKKINYIHTLFFWEK